VIAALKQKQRGIFKKVAEFFQILRAEGTVDDAMVAAHRDRHAMTDDDLIRIVDHRNFGDFADGQNESLRRIDHGAERIDSHSTEI